MKTLDKIPSTSPNANQARAEYQQLLAWLLAHCYGLETNDTPYHDEQAIAQQIEHCVTIQHDGFTYEADTLGSFGHVCIAVYQTILPTPA